MQKSDQKSADKLCSFEPLPSPPETQSAEVLSVEETIQIVQTNIQSELTANKLSQSGSGIARGRLTPDEQSELENLMGKDITAKKLGLRGSYPDEQKKDVIRTVDLLRKQGNYGSIGDYLKRINVSRGLLAYWENAWKNRPSPPNNVDQDKHPVELSPTTRTPFRAAPTQTKDPDVPAWIRTRETVMRRAKSADQLAKEKESSDEILKKVGLVIDGDQAMEEMWHAVCCAMHDETQVLLRGETGTGKELVARAIHEGRNGGLPWKAVNCAGLSSGVIESELFGHVKGAFSDAYRDREGAFGAIAKQGGTLLLDEIGDMPPDQQTKLLRVLENRQFNRVGSDDNITLHANAKVIAATNKSLEDLMRTGHFRQDLFFRLAQNEIHIPPLRNRNIDHRKYLLGLFVRKLSTNDRPVSMTQEAFDIFRSTEYPGNVRELQNRVMWACKQAAADYTGDVLIEGVHAKITMPVKRTVEETLQGQENRNTLRNTLIIPFSNMQSYSNGALLMGASADHSTVQVRISIELIQRNFKELLKKIAIKITTECIQWQPCEGSQIKVSVHLKKTRGYIRDCLRADENGTFAPDEITLGSPRNQTVEEPMESMMSYASDALLMGHSADKSTLFGAFVLPKIQENLSYLMQLFDTRATQLYLDVYNNEQTQASELLQISRGRVRERSSDISKRHLTEAGKPL